MHKFWFDYMKPKYDEKAILCYMNRLYKKQIIFIKISQKMLKQDFIVEYIN